MVTLIIQTITLLVLLFFLAFFAVQFFNIFFRGYAPFVSTRPKVIKSIIGELAIKEDATVYELGCGRAGFLRALRKKYPKAKLFGVEYSFWPYLVAEMQNSLSKSKLEIMRKNMFKVDLSGADVIYCYLNAKMMEELAKKFKGECKPGATVISYTFPLHGMPSEKVLEVGKNEKVYFYRF